MSSITEAGIPAKPMLDDPCCIPLDASAVNGRCSQKPKVAGSSAAAAFSNSVSRQCVATPSENAQRSRTRDPVQKRAAGYMMPIQRCFLNSRSPLTKRRLASETLKSRSCGSDDREEQWNPNWWAKNCPICSWRMLQQCGGRSLNRPPQEAPERTSRSGPLVIDAEHLSITMCA